MNLLFCSVGRRGELIKNFKKSMNGMGKIVATDSSNLAPAMYLADKQYIVPLISDDDYVEELLQICQKEEIHGVTTFIDPEIEVLSENRERFEAIGVQVFTPHYETAKLCFDKYAMYQHLTKNHIPTVLTFADLEDFLRAFKNEEIGFPVFVKPRTGSGSVGARKIETLEELQYAMQEDSNLIVQPFMHGQDLDADVYVDTITHEVVSVFAKKKLSTTIGGANKTVSFRDEKLYVLIQQIAQILDLNGPNDMDFFCKDGNYYLSEINPRFGGAYLHAYGAGVDFVQFIDNNIRGIANIPSIGTYEEGTVMMMYDSVVIKKKEELIAIDE